MAIGALAALSACGDPVTENTSSEPVAAPARIETSPSPVLTPQPAALVPDVIDEAMRRDRGFDGGLGCVFRRGEDLLFVGAANDASRAESEGLMVIDGEAQTLRMDGGGGYNALSGTPSFTGTGGLEVDIDVSSEASDPAAEPDATGPVPLAATMNLSRGEQSLQVEGTYECGPQPEA